MAELIWKEDLPKEPGYYYTNYTNTDGNKYFKSIWFNAEKNLWCEWRPGVVKEVHRYLEGTRHDYYIPSEDIAIAISKKL